MLQFGQKINDIEQKINDIDQKINEIDPKIDHKNGKVDRSVSRKNLNLMIFAPKKNRIDCTYLTLYFGAKKLKANWRQHFDTKT